jgi:hypothetical protein
MGEFINFPGQPAPKQDIWGGIAQVAGAYSAGQMKRQNYLEQLQAERVKAGLENGDLEIDANGNVMNIPKAERYKSRMAASQELSAAADMLRAQNSGGFEDYGTGATAKKGVALTRGSAEYQQLMSQKAKIKALALKMNNGIEPIAKDWIKRKLQSSYGLTDGYDEATEEIWRG